MKKLIKLTTIILFFASILYACKKDAADPTVDCNSSGTQQVGTFFNALNSQSGYFMYDNMDLLTHEYTFTANTNIQICGFGYKSQGSQLFYRIELIASDGTSLYNQQLSFDANQFEYVSVPPITVNAGTYTIKRTVVNNINASDVIGPITRAGTQSSPTDPTFPINIGSEITILSANFSGGGGPVPNYGVPNIYFEYIAL